jgi:hypothetical protein
MNVTVEEINIKFLEGDKLIGEFDVKDNEEIVELMNSDKVKGYDSFEFYKKSILEGNAEGAYFLNTEENIIKASKEHLIGYMKSITDYVDSIKAIQEVEKNGRERGTDSESERIDETNPKSDRLS